MYLSTVSCRYSSRPVTTFQIQISFADSDNYIHTYMLCILYSVATYMRVFSSCQPLFRSARTITSVKQRRARIVTWMGDHRKF